MKFRRRKYIIDTGFQIRIILIFTVLAFLGSFIAATAFNYFALKKLEAFMWSTHVRVKTTGEILNPLFMYVNVTSFLFVSILLIITAVWITRKTAGPLYRISKDIYNVISGDLTTNITLRQKDEFKDTAFELNTMLKNIKGKFNIINTKYMSISKSIENLNKKITASEIATVDCDSILSNINSLEKELTNFKLRKK